MTDTNTSYNAYSNAIASASHFDQLITLYDGVIKFLLQAKVAIENQEYDKKFNLLSRASGVIHGLQECLDSTQENETVTALNQAYEDIDSLILSALAHDNTEFCDKAVDHLRQLREAWKEAESVYNQTQTEKQQVVPESGSEQSNATINV